MKHTIYYDAECPFCIKWKERIEKLDKKHIFKFEPLEFKSDTLVLIESSGRKWLRARAIFRIFYLLGYFIPGCFYHLPSGLIDPIYRFIAKSR